MAETEELMDHDKSYIAVGRSRTSVRGAGFLIMCLGAVVLAVFALKLSEQPLAKEIVLIIIGGLINNLGSATTHYFSQKKS